MVLNLYYYKKLIDHRRYLGLTEPDGVLDFRPAFFGLGFGLLIFRGSILAGLFGGGAFR